MMVSVDIIMFQTYSVAGEDTGVFQEVNHASTHATFPPEPTAVWAYMHVKQNESLPSWLCQLTT
jgi:hypothetical protein